MVLRSPSRFNICFFIKKSSVFVGLIYTEKSARQQATFMKYNIKNSYSTSLLSSFSNGGSGSMFNS